MKRDWPAILTAAMFGWVLGIAIGRAQVPAYSQAQLAEINVALAQERAVACAQARALVRQHELVRNTWPDAPNPRAIVAACDAEDVRTTKR